jgi:hypothetical protein
VVLVLGQRLVWDSGIAIVTTEAGRVERSSEGGSSACTRRLVLRYFMRQKWPGLSA